MQFTGQIQARMDAKGRLFFPAEFRRQVGGAEPRFVLKRDVYQPCLVIYPFAAWEAEVAALRQRLNRWKAQEAMLFRQFLSDVEVFGLDANGRFLVPRRFLALLGETRHVTFLGVDDRIELWDAARTAEPFMAPADFSAALEQAMTRPADDAVAPRLSDGLPSRS